MPTSPHFVFKSEAFPVEPGEDAEVNPGVFGKALSGWLADELRKAGYEIKGALAEDYGRLVELGAPSGRLYVAASSTDETATEWRVFAISEQGLLTRLRGGPGTREILARITPTLRTLLGTHPGIRDLQEDGDIDDA
jgi:hypothetical protein